VRIIAGKFRSRQLKSLKKLTLRPTSDRLRETLFDILGNLVVGSRFIDAFAGTGAVGIEALSRSAAEVIFIEKNPNAASLIKQNLEVLQIRTGARVLPIDALHGLELLAKEIRPQDDHLQILFLDPPYANAAEYDRALSIAGSSPLLASGSLVIAEHRRAFGLPEAVEHLQCVRVLRQGDAALTFYRVVKTAPENNALAQ
jgi:16S rRNA (guanine966-N2)-methyltransferase